MLFVYCTDSPNADRAPAATRVVVHDDWLHECRVGNTPQSATGNTGSRAQGTAQPVYLYMVLASKYCAIENTVRDERSDYRICRAPYRHKSVITGLVCRPSLIWTVFSR